MQQGEHKPGLIRSRPAATIVLLLSWILAILTFRDLFRLPAHGSAWLLPPDFVQPRWLFVALNVAFYAYLSWSCVVLFRITLGKERILAAGFYSSMALGLIQGLVSPFAATAIQYARVAGMVVAFVAAALIFIEGPAHPLPSPSEATAECLKSPSSDRTE
jgi:hypothetical protein